MGKKGGSPPPAPDPVATANAQAQANKEAIYASAQVNSPNLYGPSGSVTYTRDGNGVPTAQHVNLTPQGQQIFDTQQTVAGTLTNQALQRVNALPTNPFTLQGAPYDPSSYDVRSSFPTFNPVRTAVPGGNGMSFGGGQQQPPANYYGYGMPAAPQPQYGNFGNLGGGNTSPTSFATSQAQSYTGGAGGGAQTNPSIYMPPSFFGAPDPAEYRPAVAAKPAVEGKKYWINDFGEKIYGDPPTQQQSAGELGPWGIPTATRAYQTGVEGGSPAVAAVPEHIGAPKFNDTVARNFLNNAYQQYLGRAPDAKGLESYTNNLKNDGWSAQKVIDSIAGSDERKRYLAAHPASTQSAPQVGFGGGQPGGQPSAQPFDIQAYLKQNPQAAQAFNQFANTGQLPPGFSIPGLSAAGTVPNSGIPNGNNAVVPYDPATYGNLNMYNDAAGNAVFDNQATMLAPQFKQENEQLLQNLADRGIPVGSDAYNKAMDQLSRQHTQQWQSVANTATAASTGAAQQKMAMEQALNSAAFGQALQTHNTQTGDYLNQINLEQTLRNTAIQNALLARTQNLNEASAYLQGSPALQQPTAPQMPTYNIAPAPIADSTYRSFDAAMQGYNAQVQQSQAMWQGITNLAGTGAKLAFGSARELKHDDGPPIRVLDALDKITVRTWRYKPEIDPSQALHIGPYADDWRKHTGFGDGKIINAIDAIGICLQAIKELQAEIATLKEAA